MLHFIIDIIQKIKTRFLILKVIWEIDSKSFEEVIPKLEKLYNTNPKDIIVLNGLAHIHYKRKDYKKALEFVRKALDECPNDLQALKYRAWIYDETGDKDQYKKILWQIYDSGEADWEVYGELAEILEDNGQLLWALSLFTKGIQDPNNYQPLHAAIGGANCYSKSGAFEIADEIYDTLLNIYPGDSTVLYNKAGNYERKGEPEKAAKILQEEITGESRKELGQNLLSFVTRMQNKNDFKKKSNKTEKTEFNTKVNTEPDLNIDEDEIIDKLINEFYNLMDKYKLYEAKDKLKEILLIDDSLPIVWLNLANIHYILLELPKSIEFCDKALSLLHDNNDWHFTAILEIQAKTLFALGKLKEALVIVDDLISSDSDNYMAIMLKARILNRQEKYTETLKILLPSIGLFPPEKEITGFANYLLATAYYKLGKKVQFDRAIRESVRLGCEFGTRWFRVLNCERGK